MLFISRRLRAKCFVVKVLFEARRQERLKFAPRVPITHSGGSLKWRGREEKNRVSLLFLVDKELRDSYIKIEIPAYR